MQRERNDGNNDGVEKDVGEHRYTHSDEDEERR